jgi:Zn-dependent protease with chaperone function
MLSSLFQTEEKDIKDPSEFGIEIPIEVKKLVERFDPKIRIKIIDIPNIHAQAPISRTPYIELSTRLFEKRTNSIEQFTKEDIRVLVAHELGHLIPKSHFDFSVKFILTVVAILIMWSCLTLSPYPLLGIVLLMLWLSYLSRREEYRADRFAIIEAGISVESFVQCFSKAEIIQKQEFALESGVTHLLKMLLRLILKTHPRIDQRILKVRSL